MLRLFPMQAERIWPRKCRFNLSIGCIAKFVVSRIEPMKEGWLQNYLWHSLNTQSVIFFKNMLSARYENSYILSEQEAQYSYNKECTHTQAKDDCMQSQKTVRPKDTSKLECKRKYSYKRHKFELQFPNWPKIKIQLEKYSTVYL